MLAAIRCPKGEVERNLAAHLRLLAQAAAEGCELVLFPEMSLTGSADPATHPERLIPLDHPAVAALAEATGGTGVGTCFGVAERSPGGDPYICQVFAAAGRVAGAQRKRHLGEGEEAFTAATEPVIFEHAGARFGVAICAEAGFDGPFDAAAAGDARLVLFPAAPGLYGRRTDEASWQQGFTGGRARLWATRAATRAAGACGSPWRARQAPRSMRTSPAWRRWSGRTAT